MRASWLIADIVHARAHSDRAAAPPISPPAGAKPLVRRHVKFCAGPEAQKIAVEMTGYLPTNRRAEAEEFLGAWYRQNPNALAAARQADKSLPWEDYGANGPRIHRMQQEVLTGVMRGDLAPEAGLERMVAQTAQLMRG
jgi:multiple sugar transport system substrate-binding protein